MSTMASQITGLTIVYPIVYLSADQRKHQSSALLAFVRGIHLRPVNSRHKGLVTRKMCPFDDVIMNKCCGYKSIRNGYWTSNKFSGTYYINFIAAAIFNSLTHWRCCCNFCCVGRVIHISLSNLTTIVPDNGLSLGRCQAIIWTNAGILLSRTIGTNFSEVLSEIHAFKLLRDIWVTRPQLVNSLDAIKKWIHIGDATPLIICTGMV